MARYHQDRERFYNTTAPNPKGITGRRKVRYVGPGHTVVYYEDRVLDIQFDESPQQYAQKIRKVVREREQNRNRWNEGWQFEGIPDHSSPATREELDEMRKNERAKRAKVVGKTAGKRKAPKKRASPGKRKASGKRKGSSPHLDLLDDRL